MRLRKDKGVGIKGALQATQDPDVPKIIPVLYLVIIYYSISIENTDSIILYILLYIISYSNAIVLCIQVLLLLIL